jgi:hypothetical protein
LQDIQEGDLIIGKNTKSAIGTLVERTTRYAILLYLPNGHTAAGVRDAIIKKFNHLPDVFKKTITWDQASRTSKAQRYRKRNQHASIFLMILIHRGKEEQMKTPMDYLEIGFQKELTYLFAPKNI